MALTAGHIKVWVWYLACCSSGESGMECSVRNPPRSCWSWGWRVSFDGATSHHHPESTNTNTRQSIMSSIIYYVSLNKQSDKN